MKKLPVFLILILLSLSVDLKPLSFDSMRSDQISVIVKGAVEYQGEYDLQMYSTVENALEAAGITDASDLSAINPSLVLKDHDVIYVPEKKDEEEKSRISINTAGIEELCTLKGIGPSTAERIIAFREENGLFQSIEDLMRVKGIGESRFEKIRDDICL